MKQDEIMRLDVFNMLSLVKNKVFIANSIVIKQLNGSFES